MVIALFIREAPNDSGHQRHDQQSHQVDDLDQRIHRRARGVLAGSLRYRRSRHRLCASRLPLPPKWPSSMYFLALSQAPPPVVIEMATNRAGDDGR